MKKIKLLKDVAHNGVICKPGTVLEVPESTFHFLVHSSPPWAEPVTDQVSAQSSGDPKENQS